MGTVHTLELPRPLILAESARHFLNARHTTDQATEQKAQRLERALGQIVTSARFALATGAEFDLERCAHLCDKALAGAAS